MGLQSSWKKLTTREKTLLTIKIFNRQKFLAFDYNAREDLKPVIPDIHKIFSTVGGFDKCIMELEMKYGEIK